MPQPRRLSDEQEDQALAEYRASKAGSGAWGLISRMARARNVSFTGMKLILKRAEERESTSNIPRETLNLDRIIEEMRE